MNNLDHIGLVTFVESSRHLYNYAQNERAFWIHKIQELVPNEDFEQDWNAILTQCEPRMLEKIAKSMVYGSNLGPMKMAVHSDDSELYQHCSARLQNGTFDSAFLIQRIQEMVPYEEDWMEVTKQCGPRMLEKIAEATRITKIMFYGSLLEPLKIAVHSNDSELYQHFSARIGNGTIDFVYDQTSQKTAFHVAAEKGHLRILSYILKNIDANDEQPQDISGWTPLHFAAHRGQSEACKMFAQFGLRHMTINEQGSTPLHLAINQGVQGLSCWKILRKFTGCDLSDAEGNTPLHLAARIGNLTLVKEIIKISTEPAAAVKIRNYDGLKPLDLAEKIGNEFLRKRMIFFLKGNLRVR